jgi:hypothetical protein
VRPKREVGDDRPTGRVGEEREPFAPAGRHRGRMPAAASLALIGGRAGRSAAARPRPAPPAPQKVRRVTSWRR